MDGIGERMRRWDGGARREGAPPVRKVVRRQVLLREPRQRDAVDAALRVPVRVLPACMHIQGVLSVLKANGICFAIWESKPKANERQTESKRKANEKQKSYGFFSFHSFWQTPGLKSQEMSAALRRGHPCTSHPPLAALAWWSTRNGPDDPPQQTTLRPAPTPKPAPPHPALLGADR